MVEFIKITCRKKSEQENQNRTEQTETAEGRSFVYLVTFIKLNFRQSNIVCIGILSFLIVKTNSLAIF